MVDEQKPSGGQDEVLGPEGFSQEDLDALLAGLKPGDGGAESAPSRSPNEGSPQAQAPQPVPRPSADGNLSQDDVEALFAAQQAGEPASQPTRQDSSPVHMPSTPPAPAARDNGNGQEFGAFDLADFHGEGLTEQELKRVTMLGDVNLRVKIQLGRTRMLIEDVLKLGEGSVVELDKLAGDPVDVLVNDRLVARGEVLVLNDNFCVRISEVLSQDPHRIAT